MFRVKVIVLLSAVVLAVSFVNCSIDDDDSTKFTLVQDSGESIPLPQYFFVDKEVQSDLNVQHFLPKDLIEDLSPRLEIPYKLGQRQNGDRLIVRYKFPRASSTTPFNVRLNDVFELEAYITCVEETVSQSTNEGKVTLVSGGIGQKDVGLLTEANNTLYINYTIAIYGYF